MTDRNTKNNDKQEKEKIILDFNNINNLMKTLRKSENL